MNHAPSRPRLLFNPLFRAIWIGIIASSLGSWLYAGAADTALLLMAVRMSTSLPMCLLALLSVVVSLYGQRHGHHQFAFQKMGSSAFAVSILTFIGFVGPWVMLCSAVILGLCAAIAALSLQPVWLELLSKADVPRNLAFGAFSALGTNFGRAAWNLASGILATVIGPAAIFILSALSLGAAFIAGRTRHIHYGVHHAH
jgi:MFS family permease